MTSGIYGGALLTVTGNGFSRNMSALQIMVGTKPCPIVQATLSQIQCTIPSQGNGTSLANILVNSNGIAFPGSFSLTYSSASTPIVSSINPTSGTVNQLLNITGSNFVFGVTTVTINKSPCTINSISSTLITCTISSGPAGVQPVTVLVTTYGYSNTDVQFTYSLQVTSVSPIEGSYGGGQPVTITGDGFNGTNVAVSICNQACRTVTILSNTQLQCVTPAITATTSYTSCNLTVNVSGLSQNVPYTYRANLTATITGINPTRGGTGGGTTLIINGTNFP